MDENNNKIITRKIGQVKVNGINQIRLNIPEEMGLIGGDVVKFEKINDKEIRLTKLT